MPGLRQAGSSPQAAADRPGGTQQDRSAAQIASRRQLFIRLAKAAGWFGQGPDCSRQGAETEECGVVEDEAEELRLIAIGEGLCERHLGAAELVDGFRSCGGNGDQQGSEKSGRVTDSVFRQRNFLLHGLSITACVYVR